MRTSTVLWWSVVEWNRSLSAPWIIEMSVPSVSRTKCVRTPWDAMVLTPRAVVVTWRSTRLPSKTSVIARTWV
ncbi:hypothetical protein [Nocardiopsis ansamitocini]|uniref:hypothetical protein n=1 Tax=Nocardiopsis ansamitocini TaxID=1670832 RepID=UPI002553F3ED|nr:hypothetical protein [Nocardiopsis ansamitocini]